MIQTKTTLTRLLETMIAASVWMRRPNCCGIDRQVAVPSGSVKRCFQCILKFMIETIGSRGLLRFRRNGVAPLRELTSGRSIVAAHVDAMRFPSFGCSAVALSIPTALVRVFIGHARLYPEGGSYGNL
jgi:hypothetical protein